jgi:hypothetical protein
MDEHIQKRSVCFYYLWLENIRTIMEIRLLFGYVFFNFQTLDYYFVRNLRTLMCAKLINLIDIGRSIN